VFVADDPHFDRMFKMVLIFYRMFKMIIIFAIRVLFDPFSVTPFKSVTEHCTSDNVCITFGVCYMYCTDD